MQIIVKLSDVVDFYKEYLKRIHKTDLNSFPDFYHENEDGLKTSCDDPFLMGLNVRFKDMNEKKLYLLDKKIK